MMKRVCMSAAVILLSFALLTVTAAPIMPAKPQIDGPVRSLADLTHLVHSSPVVRHDALLDLLRDTGQQQVQAPRHASANHDYLGIEDVEEGHNPNAEAGAGLVHDGQRHGVARFRRLRNRSCVDLRRTRQRARFAGIKPLARYPGNGGTGGEGLEASEASAVAPGPAPLNGEVSYLSGEAAPPRVEPSVYYDSPTDSGAQRHVNQMPVAPAGAVLLLGERRQRGVVGA